MTCGQATVLVRVWSLILSLASWWTHKNNPSYCTSVHSCGTNNCITYMPRTFIHWRWDCPLKWLPNCSQKTLRKYLGYPYIGSSTTKKWPILLTRKWCLLTVYELMAKCVCLLLLNWMSSSVMLCYNMPLCNIDTGYTCDFLLNLFHISV